MKGGTSTAETDEKEEFSFAVRLQLYEFVICCQWVCMTNVTF